VKEGAASGGVRDGDANSSEGLVGWRHVPHVAKRAVEAGRGWEQRE
jgi:hypothetical protein